jgi:hypothetical protein
MNLNDDDVRSIFIQFTGVVEKEFIKKLNELKPVKTLTEKKLSNKDVIGNLDLTLFITDKKAMIVDYKSGNSMYHNFEQLYIYAVLLYDNYPELDEIMVIYYYFNDDKVLKNLFHKSEHEFFRKKIEKEIATIENNTHFEKNRKSCHFCMYKHSCMFAEKVEEIKINLAKKLHHGSVNDLFIADGNFNSKTVLLMEKPNLITIKNQKIKSIIFDKVPLSKYLVLYSYFLDEEHKDLKKECKESLVELLKLINPKKIVCIGEKAYQNLTNTETPIDYLLEKTFSISFDKNEHETVLEVIHDERKFIHDKNINTEYFKEKLC